MRRDHDAVLIERSERKPDHGAEGRHRRREPVARHRVQGNGNCRVPDRDDVLDREEPLAERPERGCVQIAVQRPVLVERIAKDHAAVTEIENLTQLIPIVRHVDKPGLESSRREIDADQQRGSREPRNIEDVDAIGRVIPHIPGVASGFANG